MLLLSAGAGGGRSGWLVRYVRVRTTVAGGLDGLAAAASSQYSASITRATTTSLRAQPFFFHWPLLPAVVLPMSTCHGRPPIARLHARMIVCPVSQEGTHADAFVGLDWTWVPVLSRPGLVRFLARPHPAQLKCSVVTACWQKLCPRQGSCSKGLVG